MQGVFTLITARRRLDPECHEIRVQQGKYRAAVKPTLSIHSLGITEVHIVKVPRRAGAMGAVSDAHTHTHIQMFFLFTMSVKGLGGISGLVA